MIKEKVNVLGVGFNPVTYEEIIDFLKNKGNRKKYISFPDIYNIVRSNHDSFLKSIYNNSTLTLPDGKPSEFFLKKKGFKNVTTISGFWLCKKLLDTELSHFFYGTSPENLQLMKNFLDNEFPNAKILGYKSPPLILQEEIEESIQIKEDLKVIRKIKPNIIWIGISSPKQDFLMHYFHSTEPGTIMIGVGAVFDYFAGTAYMGPEWLKKIGLRWFYQLLRDPKRYYRRLLYVLMHLPAIILKNNKK
ncbi:WecB/TagA/CpsF family glycosyltransferase [Polaribacter marinivivus]|uniref:WecB/TagA/CpsF family glycosyltransferase n=1 Tax=Polaribacter marinivivus TaxID=1524260 RepID=A0ABV8RCT0_9FLAO